MKIRPNELRIGNVVYDSLGESDIVIEGITKSKEEYGYEYVVEFDDSMSATVLKEFDGEQYIKPIPLTAEWLKRFGFNDITKKQGIPYPTFEKKYRHVLVESRIELQEIDTDMWMWLEGNTNVHLYYVHQLQNLYFALTGTELELKK